MGGNEHANNMQIACKPIQDPPEGSGAATGAEIVRSLPAQEGGRDPQVLCPQGRLIQPSLGDRGQGQGVENSS